MNGQGKEKSLSHGILFHILSSMLKKIKNFRPKYLTNNNLLLNPKRKSLPKLQSIEYGDGALYFRRLTRQQIS